ncbi:NAD-dependent epimerase/dehydratase family protein [Deinococcus hopiensis]|uniref:NAD-dependent epimerase/dehydratase domain-containing protein n=1 Tax=Deinococcus hopiensis KR-140 TaxID=695939 RepID=A0A1W1U9K5_9DEIO|nr:NAD-dependent epimerase/dehydratase family protein [Deinococcus hopiensis]SMB77722.1 hypothetical protein SAMN00790413_03879 [Deinococcus hopiensis KR-140]
MFETQQQVMVTGASGYLASWVVEDLLRHGHTVHGTVRHLKDKGKTQHLIDLAKRYPQRLKLFEADLVKEGSFDDAMKGCSVVIHTASPYFLEKPKDVEQQLIKPALQGTQNVLASVNRTETVQRVVLTSSIAALYNDACDVKGRVGHLVQEDDVNPNTHSQHNPYAYSKTMAERAAWEVCRQQGRWDLVSIHPGAMFGPSMSKRSDATSVTMMTQFLSGSYSKGVPRLWLGFVDVRDVASAHVRAATQPRARGRYIIVAQSLRLLEIAQLMKVREFGLEDRLPRSEMPKILMWLVGPLVGMQRNYISRNVNHPIQYDGKRVQAELSLRYRELGETVNDHIRQLVNDGLVSAR